MPRHERLFIDSQLRDQRREQLQQLAEEEAQWQLQSSSVHRRHDLAVVERAVHRLYEGARMRDERLEEMRRECERSVLEKSQTFADSCAVERSVQRLYGDAQLRECAKVQQREQRESEERERLQGESVHARAEARLQAQPRAGEVAAISERLHAMRSLTPPGQRREQPEVPKGFEAVSAKACGSWGRAPRWPSRRTRCQEERPREPRDASAPPAALAHEASQRSVVAVVADRRGSNPDITPWDGASSTAVGRRPSVSLVRSHSGLTPRGRDGDRGRGGASARAQLVSGDTASLDVEAARTPRRVAAASSGNASTPRAAGCDAAAALEAPPAIHRACSPRSVGGRWKMPPSAGCELVGAPEALRIQTRAWSAVAVNDRSQTPRGAPCKDVPAEIAARASRHACGPAAAVADWKRSAGQMFPDSGLMYELFERGAMMSIASEPTRA